MRSEVTDVPSPVAAWPRRSSESLNASLWRAWRSVMRPEALRLVARLAKGARALGERVDERDALRIEEFERDPNPDRRILDSLHRVRDVGEELLGRA